MVTLQGTSHAINTALVVCRKRHRYGSKVQLRRREDKSQPLYCGSPSSVETSFLQFEIDRSSFNSRASRRSSFSTSLVRVLAGQVHTRIPPHYPVHANGIAPQSFGTQILELGAFLQDEGFNYCISFSFPHILHTYDYSVRSTTKFSLRSPVWKCLEQHDRG